MTKKRLVSKSKINFGWLIYLLTFFIILIDIIFIYDIFLIKFSLYFIIPIFVLNLGLYHLIRLMFWHDFELFSTGLKIRKRYIKWEDIKSISFQTGRPITDRTFYKKFKLPTLQKIFVLDNEGKEYSCIIDIDYSFKGKRDKNNLLKIKDLLYALEKMNILSDWAEKR